VINHGHLERVPGHDDRRQQDPKLDGRDDRDFRHHQQEDDHDQFRGERQIHTRTLRLDFPRFSGDNPYGWTYKVNQFFEYYQTLMYQRVCIASFHMEGEALVWFQDADEAGQFPIWETFLQSLLTRFGPAYDDPIKALTKLHQTSTVTEYTSQFESLSNRLCGFSDRNRLSCFLSGLNDEIRLQLRMLNPLTLVAAFGLAKLHKEYLISTKKSLKPAIPASSFSRNHYWSSSSSTPAPTPITPNPNTRPQNNYPVKKISPSQMHEHREKGLCYYYDDKWNLGHKCKSPKIYLLIGMDFPDEDRGDEIFFDSTDDTPTLGENAVLKGIEPAISLHAIARPMSPNTMRLVGFIQNQRVVILVDSGSTHNFVDPAVLLKIPLLVVPTPKLHVKVANGAKVMSGGRCQSVALRLQFNTFITNFYILTLKGYDVVLGIEWLRTLRPILWNFDSLTMQFQWGEHTVTLNSLSPTGLSLKDGHHFLKGSTSRNKGVLLQLYAHESANVSNTIPEHYRR
jgi:hypothetical protein